MLNRNDYDRHVSLYQAVTLETKNGPLLYLMFAWDWINLGEGVILATLP